MGLNSETWGPEQETERRSAAASVHIFTTATGTTSVAAKSEWKLVSTPIQAWRVISGWVAKHIKLIGTKSTLQIDTRFSFVNTAFLWLCPSLPATETLKWLSSLPILMQESFWWWQCSDRYIISLFPPPPPSLPPFPPSLISLVVSVDVKHHVYLVLDTNRA